MTMTNLTSSSRIPIIPVHTNIIILIELTIKIKSLIRKPNMHFEKIQKIAALLNKIVLGKQNQIHLSLSCILAQGHLLLEDLPGMGKTTLAHALAISLGLGYQRIQFTSDLLPGDILGGEIFNPETQQFTLHQGPIFTEVLLADEINRATPKSQSALLEAMAEKQVSIGRKSYRLPEHFFVIATQNPNTTGSGTYPLPDSQLDRFLMNLSLGYPSFETEMRLLKGENIARKIRLLKPIITKEELSEIQNFISEIPVSDTVLEYILRVVETTRTNSQFSVGLSPRGSMAMLMASRAYAYLHHRKYVTIDDVKAILPAVCAHRLRDGRNVSSESAQNLCQWLLTNVSALGA